MGLHKTKSRTLPSSPIHHHSSSCDFEFTVSLSPRKSATTTILRPADELFYNGQLLPLHVSPRNSMVRTLLLTSNTITARHSSDYHSSLSYQTSNSSRPSSATDDDINLPRKLFDLNSNTQTFLSKNEKKVLRGKRFSFNRFSSVFRKETKPAAVNTTNADPTTSVKEKIRKYLKKVKPNLYQKFSPHQGQETDNLISPSFSGNLRFLRKTSCVSSCPSTMPSSPNHSGVLCRKTSARSNNSSSTTEEVQSAIQGAIAHCKNMISTNQIYRVGK